MIKNKKSKNEGFSLVGGLMAIGLVSLVSMSSPIASRSMTHYNNHTHFMRNNRAIHYIVHNNRQRVKDIKSVVKAMEKLHRKNGDYKVECETHEFCFGSTCIQLPSKIVSSCDFSPYLNANKINDPSGSTVACEGNNNDTCNYAYFYKAPSRQNYIVYFYLEGNGIQNDVNCATDGKRVVCDENVSYNYCVGRSQEHSTPEVWNICSMYDVNENGQVQNDDKNDYF